MMPDQNSKLSLLSKKAKDFEAFQERSEQLKKSGANLIPHSHYHDEPNIYEYDSEDSYIDSSTDITKPKKIHSYDQDFNNLSMYNQLNQDSYNKVSSTSYPSQHTTLRRHQSSNKKSNTDKRNTKSKYYSDSDDESPDDYYKHDQPSYSKLEKMKLKEKENRKKIAQLEAASKDQLQKFEDIAKTLTDQINYLKTQIPQKQRYHDPYNSNSYNNDEEASPKYKPSKRYNFGNLTDDMIKRPIREHPPVNWSEYDEHPTLKAISKEEADKIRERNNIFVQAPDNLSIPTPISRFDTEIFPKYVMEYIAKWKFNTPTPIQMQTWPIIMNCYDVLAIAETGSGKTLSFLIPAFLHIMRQEAIRADDGPICLVLSPTRELAKQIAQVTSELCELKDDGENKLKVYCSHGGLGISTKNEYRNKIAGIADILVASLGRLIGLLKSDTNFNLGRVSFLVVDEADKMFDADTYPLVKFLSLNLSEDRQTLYFSASWDQSLNNIISDLSKRPCFKVSTHAELKTQIAKSIKQVLHISKEHQMELNYKLEVIKTEILQLDNKKAIIFCNTRKDAEFLVTKLKQTIKQVHLQYIHGGLTQPERTMIMENFASKNTKVLISTDLLQRGIDITSVALVINYSCPRSLEDYTHRIGRTGRSGRKGRSVTFVDYNQNNFLEILTTQNQDMEIIEYQKTSSKRDPT